MHVFAVPREVQYVSYSPPGIHPAAPGRGGGRLAGLHTHTSCVDCERLPLCERFFVFLCISFFSRRFLLVVLRFRQLTAHSGVGWRVTLVGSQAWQTTVSVSNTGFPAALQ